MPHGKSPKHARKKKARATASSKPRGKTADGARGRTSPPSPTRAADVDVSIDRSVRLQKLLAAAGFGSRRDTEQFLRDGRVSVNRRTAKLGDRADPSVDEIRVDGERLAREKAAYWLVHKPRGYITTVRDDAGRKTVMDLLPRGIGRLYPIGRLDKETSGLLLMTNDGDTAHALLHPSLGNEREYKVNVKGVIDAKAVARLEKGIVLEEGRTAAGQVRQIRQDAEASTSNFLLILGEGKKRQIRRSLLMLGFPVRRLVRVRMGPLRLGRLGVGEARPLRSDERRVLLDHVAMLRGDKRKPAARTTQRTARSRKGTSK